MIIVCFASVAWDGLWQRHQQIMSRLAKRGHKIIYVEPTNILQAIKRPYPIFFRRIEEKDEIILVRPLFFPLHWKIKILEKIDYLITSYLLHKVLKILDEKEVDVMWSFSPYFNFAVSVIKTKILVYDCADESEGFYSSKLAKTWILGEEKKILKKADIVFVTSSRLYQRCILQNSNVHLAPNGVSSNFFEKYDRIPNDIKKSKHPILGFVGSLANWLDYDILCKAAMKNEDCSFVFVGPINTRNPRLRDLRNRKNVYFLGEKKHEEIPAYIKQFDVCLIPFDIQGLTNSSSPLKLFEYFALGKPVVSTKINEVKKFAGLVYLAKNNDFANQIKIALNENDRELQEKRKCVAKEYSWDKIVEKIERNLLSLVNKNNS